mmetsp:Transcript_7252/g.18590  ORF Transcript_7252/g.18590 Transcript_7252/m.18590 type:complete len:203 (-) Transcript_7252:786-1394(-)
MARRIASTSAGESPWRASSCRSASARCTVTSHRPPSASAYTMKVETTHPSEGASLTSNSTPVNGGLGRSRLFSRRATQHATMRSVRNSARSATLVRLHTGSLAKRVSEKDCRSSCLKTVGGGRSAVGCSAARHDASAAARPEGAPASVQRCVSWGLSRRSARLSAASDRGRPRTERNASVMRRSQWAGETSPTMYRSATSGR